MRQTRVTSFTNGAWPEGGVVRTWLRRQVGRRPLLWAAGVAASAVWVVDGGVFPGVVACLGFLGIMAVAGRWKALGLAVLLALGAGWGHQRGLEQRAEDRLRAGSAGQVAVRLDSVPRPQGRGWAAEGTLPETGTRLWVRGWGPEPERGEIVEYEGIFQEIGGVRNPAGFDRRKWLERQGIALEFRVSRRVGRVKSAPWWRTWGESFRASFREAVTRGLEESSREATVIRAVVLGEHPRDDVLIEPFRVTGTLHLFAVSGAHVGMVGMLAWAVLRLLGVRRSRALLPLVITIFGYAWLTGMNPPAMRAAWMAGLVLAAFALKRRPDLGNLLGFALMLVLLREPDLIFTAGVQLSFGVVLAIGVFHRLSSRLFTWIVRKEPYLPRVLYTPQQEGWLKVRQTVADSFAVSTSAWVGSTPLGAWHFGLLTPIGIPATVALSVLVFLVLGLGLVSGVCGMVPGVSRTLNPVNGKLAVMMIDLAKLGASVPGGNFTIPRDRPAASALIVYDLADEAAACWYGDGESVLIDSGSRRSFESEIMPSMRRMALRPRRVVGTHPDGGHVGGMALAMDAFPVEEALVPVTRSKGENFRTWIAAAEQRGVGRIEGRRGVRYPITDGVWLEVLHEPDRMDWNRVADERVMTLRLHWHGWRILFMADAGWGTERAMMESGMDLGADVIVAGRHIHDASLGEDFLRKTGARAVIATHAEFPASEQVPWRWRRAVEKAGVAVFHQGESGAVIVSLEDDALVLRGWVDGRELVLRR